MQDAMDVIGPLAGELFHPHAVELRLASAGVGVDPSALRDEFDQVLAHVTAEATLRPVSVPATTDAGGRAGVHTDALGEILGEMQALARSLPGGSW
jgi:ring-1,2-phenylacetyl-CoA epoxidase subunit PaaC